MDLLRKMKLTKAASTVKGKVEDKEEVTKYCQINTFKELPKDGKEAFFSFLCDGGVYPEEDKDICDVDPKAEGMNLMSRKYQSWLQCKQLELLSKLFKDYVTDNDMRFPEVDNCFKKSRSKDNSEDNIKDFLSRKKTDAEKSQSFITELQTEITPNLDTCFVEFKKHLLEQFRDKKT